MQTVENVGRLVKLFSNEFAARSDKTRYICFTFSFALHECVELMFVLHLLGLVVFPPLDFSARRTERGWFLEHKIAGYMETSCFEGEMSL